MIFLKDYTNNCKIKERQKYYYEVFGKFAIPYNYNNYTELRLFPFKKDYLFIYGHNAQVFKYLLENNIEEKNIVLITCYLGDITKVRIKHKNIYYWDEVTDIFNGKEFGFNFNITGAELYLYNSKENDINIKIKKGFRKVKNNGKNIRQN